MAYDKQLPSRSEDLSGWYNNLMLQAELADYGPAKGSMILRPYGFAIWELVQDYMNTKFKEYGVENAYFPLLIPESLINKEAEHLEGFSPELAVVTIAGGEELTEKLVIRPTSETIMYDSYSKWIESWRDLPVKINQWNNVLRWEKRTYLFLRTAEFLWQEGHTAHATHEEAIATQEWAMNVYADTFRNLYAMPGYIGRKSLAETFAGAVSTMTYESLMPGGKALQSATSHDLGQNFSKPFDIKFQDRNGETQFVWQTSWGLSTRTLGGLFMTHGDDQGLRLPPKLAPIQVIILPVRADEKVLAVVEQVKQSLDSVGIRARIDDREGESLGFKINKWELKGVPIRIELGPKELESQQVKITRRDTGDSQNVELSKLVSAIEKMLIEIQTSLLNQAEQFLVENTRSTTDYHEFSENMKTSKGFVKAYWCGNANCETAIKDETKATTRCKTDNTTQGKCIYCGASDAEEWYFAQAY